MARLGYERYLAQGGDWGSAVTSQVGAQDPEHCAVDPPHARDVVAPDGHPTEPDELHALERIKYYADWDSGYSKQQKTRPQTLGYGLADSPTGQLAWIVEKFWAWTDCDGHPEHALGRDEMLDNVMLYWATGSATSSARIYWESFGRASAPGRHGADRVRACTPPRSCRPCGSGSPRTTRTSCYWSEHPKGGHFAAFEVPDTFVADLREWARPLR